MPNIHSRFLKMSLLSGLFVFIDPSCFTFYYSILCFILRNTCVLYWCAIGNTIFQQKCLNFWLNFIKATSKVAHTRFYWGKLFRFFLICSLQKTHFSAKQSEYGLKVRSDYLNIHKCVQKQSQALKIYLTRHLLQIFMMRYRLFLNPNPTL